MQETDTIEIDVKELLLLLLHNIMWIILAAVVATAIAFGITWFAMTPKYTSSVSLYVNSTTQDTGAINLNEINASQKLVNTYIVVLKNDEVMERVAEQLMSEYTAESLNEVLPFSDTESGYTIAPSTIRGALSMSAVDNTEVLQISAETPNAELSARICTIMTELAPEVLQRVVKAGSVEVIGQAKIATDPSSPSVKRNIVIGFMVGAVLAIAIILLRYFLDTSIKDEDDLKKRFDIPVLGEIPDFNSLQKKGKAYRYE